MEQFSERDGGTRVLTSQGYALAADMGLLTAHVLLCGCPGVHWTIARGGKTFISFNMPVLAGFRGGLVLEPIGGSIGEAHGIIRRRRDGSAWVRILDHWSDEALETSE